MKTKYGVLFLTVVLGLHSAARAQVLSGSTGVVPSGSIIQCGAGTLDLTQLAVIAPSNCPAGGSYFLASGGPPYPCLPALFNPGLDGPDGLCD